jgi:hypothetical protein
MKDEVIPTPDIKTLQDAEKWIGIHQRFAVKDAERMSQIEARLRRLERRRFWKRSR